MIKAGDKVICIRLDYISSNGIYSKLPFEIGKLYEVNFTSYNFKLYEVNMNSGSNLMHVNGWSFGLNEADDTYIRYYKDYFITYNEWLALERERQIKTILDD